MSRYKICVIGAGFAGLSAASYLAKKGYEVHLFEKNETIGGRSRKFTTHNGYTFDMGPSWYWMPDVFENYFSDFNYATSDFYTLRQLDPAFEMVLDNHQTIKIPAHFEDLCLLFESIETGSSVLLKKMMQLAQKKYTIALQSLMHKPCLSWIEFVDPLVIKNIFRLQVFKSFSSYIKQYFKHPTLIALMEFPILFLGAMPQETPALYSLINYAGLKLGTFYPMGGFSKLIDAMASINKQWGVHIHTNNAIQKINIKNNRVISIDTKDSCIECDALIAAADYHHVETRLLDKRYRNYSHAYWEHKTFAPSCLIYYIGINKKIDHMQHHTLFFENDLYTHSIDIYKTKQWPQKPLFYVCCTSKSDPTVAPAGHENIFMLMPIAVGLNDHEDIKKKYFNDMIDRLEKHIQVSIKKNIDYLKSYCVSDFILDYNAYKGNGYGLANTLMQTAIFKPSMQNKKVKNIWYTGQLTVPGPGIPPCIISGKIVANLVNLYFNKV